jgi:hypothetical protein
MERVESPSIQMTTRSEQGAGVYDAKARGFELEQIHPDAAHGKQPRLFTG